jgi:hypothetical protein
MKQPFGLLIGAAMLVLAGVEAGGESYSVDWSVIAGGGGASSNGQYAVTGTIGQPEAGLTMAGGPYSLTGGFWSLISVVQTPGAPVLSIARAGNQVIVSWPTPSAGWTLQQNADLGNQTGWAASGYLVSTNNGTSSVTISGPVGNLFFRLTLPQ